MVSLVIWADRLKDDPDFINDHPVVFGNNGHVSGWTPDALQAYGRDWARMFKKDLVMWVEDAGK